MRGRRKEEFGTALSDCVDLGWGFGLGVGVLGFKVFVGIRPGIDGFDELEGFVTKYIV